MPAFAELIEAVAVQMNSKKLPEVYALIRSSSEKELEGEKSSGSKSCSEEQSFSESQGNQ